MRLLVGLGNPGPAYAGHRHNIGFMAVDEIVRRHGLKTPRRRFHGRTFEGEIAGERVVALRPETYMNESGLSVGAALRFYKLAPGSVIALHDEIDLKPGKMRVKLDGGASHNGLRSIDAHIGSDYWRVRLGVGHPGHRDLVRGYVLHDFGKDERALAARLVEAVAEAIPLLLGGRDDAFMSKVVLLVNPPQPKASRPKPAAPDAD